MRHLLWGILVFLGVVLLRSSAFLMTEINPDESLYLIISDHILKGHHLYTTVWDHKPPGIFWIFSLGLKTLGNSILVSRLLACGAVTITMLLLYKITFYVVNTQERLWGRITAILYAVFSLTNGGLASNSEIFFIPFICAAFLFLWRNLRLVLLGRREFNWIHPIVVGCLLGIALQIKYLVVFDCLALNLMMIYFSTQVQLSTWRSLLKYLILLNLTILGVFGIVITHFHLNDLGNNYWQATLLANQTYVKNEALSILKVIDPLITQGIRYFLFWLALIQAIRWSYQIRGDDFFCTLENQLNACILWFVCLVPSVSLSGHFFDHYFLQMLPPLCLITILVFKNKSQGQNLLLWILGGLIGCYFALSSLWSTVVIVYHRSLQSRPYWGDRPAQVADFLKKSLKPGDAIYVYNAEPILYYLTQARVPTPYLFLSHHYRGLTGARPQQEFKRLLAQSPRYIIIDTHPNDNDRYRLPELENLLQMTLNQHYEKVTVIDGITIYQSKF